VPEVDVVIVSYNSRAYLRTAVQPLAQDGDLAVIVVDNASRDSSLETVKDLPIATFAEPTNGGFASGCNRGWRAGSSPVVVFLNPDAVTDPEDLKALAAVLAEDETVGAVAPRILESDGSTAPSLRRFPRLRSTYARAFFLHRVFPDASWADELIHDPAAYEVPGSPEWASGACLAVRRRDLERLDGLDERFFMYREDVDLCLRLRALGLTVRYEPGAVVRHVGGASAPRSSLYAVLATSRIRFAKKHRSRAAALAERAGVALEALTHVVVSQGGRSARAGHARALAAALAGGAPPPA
jgi:GT2 family glycosyltransferase